MNKKGSTLALIVLIVVLIIILAAFVPQVKSTVLEFIGAVVGK